MADQDFKVNVITAADLTGIRQVDAGLDKILKRQAEAEAKWAVSPINPKNQGGGGIAALGGKPPTPPTGSDNTGITGTAVGLGTIVTLLTASLSKWREFNAEQDKWVDGMIKSQEKSRELGLSVADMLDAMKSAERIETEPLQVSFDRLKQKVTEFKTEMQLAFGAGEYEDVKRIAAALGVVESQVNRVTAAMSREAAEADKAAKARDKATEKRLSEEREFTGKALESSSAQAKAILANEENARKARASGDEKSADQFQRTADQLKKSATQGQLDEYEQLRKALLGETRPGRKAGIGESQEKVDEIERNRKAFEQIRQDEANNPDLAETNKFIKQAGGKPITQAQDTSLRLQASIDDLGRKFDKYWS